MFYDPTGTRSVAVRDTGGGWSKATADVYYDVPLYDQGTTNLCGLYCQKMTEDYNRGITRNNDVIAKEVYELACSINGADEWNHATYPQNCAGYGDNGGPLIATDISTIEDLSLYLKKNGPIYALYQSKDPMDNGKHSNHMVVVTGVNSAGNRVYTNNPWGIYGDQSYDQFLNGFVGTKKQYSLQYLIPVAYGG